MRGRLKKTITLQEGSTISLAPRITSRDPTWNYSFQKIRMKLGKSKTCSRKSWKK